MIFLHSLDNSSKYIQSFWAPPKIINFHLSLLIFFQIEINSIKFFCLFCNRPTYKTIFSFDGISFIALYVLGLLNTNLFMHLKFYFWIRHNYCNFL